MSSSARSSLQRIRDTPGRQKTLREDMRAWCFSSSSSPSWCTSSTGSRLRPSYVALAMRACISSAPNRSRRSAAAPSPCRTLPQATRFRSGPAIRDEYARMREGIPPPHTHTHTHTHTTTTTTTTIGEHIVSQPIRNWLKHAECRTHWPAHQMALPYSLLWRCKKQAKLSQNGLRAASGGLHSNLNLKKSIFDRMQDFL